MRRFVLIAFLLLMATPVLAVQPDEILSDPSLEQRARALSAQMRCLVCQNQSIDDSDAPLAKDLRVVIRERLQAGDSDEQVTRYLVDRYGEYVLLKPRFQPSTYVLWLAPFLIAGLALLYMLTRIRRPPSEVAERPLTEAELARLAAMELERDGQNYK